MPTEQQYGANIDLRIAVACGGVSFLSQESAYYTRSSEPPAQDAGQRRTDVDALNGKESPKLIQQFPLLTTG
jgi:hypothetical protein